MSLKMVPFESLGTVSYSRSIVTMALSYRFRDKARYWSKLVIFHTLYIRCCVTRVPSKYCRDVWYGKKTRMVCYPMVQKVDDTFGRFNTISARDGRTDILAMA